MADEGSAITREGTAPAGASPPVAAVADALADRGYCVQPGFLSGADLDRVRREARELWEEGAFRRAGVGRGADFQVRPEVRRDYVCWLDPAGLPPGLGDYFGVVEELRRALNERMYLGLFDFEAHLTVYPPGAFYRRHLDRFRSAPWRTISVLLYLNEGWQPADGGELRLWLDEAGEGETLEVLPEGGTLAAFASDRFWHEVLPGKRERTSVTGWLKVRT